MNGWIIFAIVVVVLIGVMVALYFVGNKMQKKQMAQKEQINAAAQPVSMFIIDKKIMPLKDAKLPKMVMEQAPKRFQKTKVPIVKAKVGPQLMTLICDETIYDDVPPHGEVKAMVSGIYLTQVRTIHKGAKKALAASAYDKNGKKRKKSMREKMISRQAAYQQQLDMEIARQKSKEEIRKEKIEEKKRREREKKIVD